MVGWSHLPPEIKQHVVKKLDFMSRHSLKSTCYTDRQIVNSSPLTIPRVRFGHKDGRCLIVIYTGVEQFLRWELFDEDDGVILERSENCYDTAGYERISIENVDSLQIGIHILKTLLAHKSIKIDVFEWDMPCENMDKFRKKMCNMEKYLNGDKFRATEVLSISFIDKMAFLNYAKRFCFEIKKLSVMRRIPAALIQRSEEDCLIKLTNTTKCGKYIITVLPEDEQFIRDQFADMECGIDWLCESCADPFEYWYHQNLTMRLIHEPFWAFGLEENSEPSAQLMELLKQKMNECTEPFKSSWGFKKIPPILQTTENPSRITKLFIWSAVILTGCIAFSIVLNLV